MREIKRNMARENMKRAGFVRINKKRIVTDPRTNRAHKTSFFGMNWRKWIYGKPSRKMA